jgi:hypothetical protein
MNERFIAVGRPRRKGEWGGRWGSGTTEVEAVSNYRKAGGSMAKGANKVIRFTSELEFAPVGRDATENEADCFCGGDGSICWIRCERIDG